MSPSESQFTFRDMEKEVFARGDFLSFRCKRNGTFLDVPTHGLLQEQGGQVAQGVQPLLDGQPLGPACAFAQKRTGLCFGYRALSQGLTVYFEVLQPETLPGLCFRLSLENQGPRPLVVEPGLRCDTPEPTERDPLHGTCYANTLWGTLAYGLSAEKHPLLPDDAQSGLSCRVTVPPFGRERVHFWLCLGTSRPVAGEMIRHLRTQGEDALTRRRRRMKRWMHMARMEAPDLLLERAWNEKAQGIEAGLRRMPSGERLPELAGHEGSLSSPAPTEAMEGLLSIGLLEPVAQSLLYFAEISKSTGPKGAIAAEIDGKGRITTPGTVESAARYVATASMLLRWSADEALLRSLFPVWTETLQYLSQMTGGFGRQPGAVPLPEPARQAVAEACAAYAQVLRVLRFPGESAYAAHAAALGHRDPAASGDLAVEWVLGQADSALREGSLPGVAEACLALMRGLFGITPQAHLKQIECRPQLPLGWAGWALHDLLIGPARFSFVCTRDRNWNTLKIYTKSKGWQVACAGQLQPLGEETTIRLEWV